MVQSFHRFLGAALAGAVLLPQVVAQEGPPTPIPVEDRNTDRPEFVPGEFLVLFERKPYDLGELRKAILAGKPAGDYARIWNRIENLAAEAREPVFAEIRQLGGRILKSYVAVNAAWISLPESKLEKLRKIEGIQRVDRNRIHHLHLRDATNSAHHNSDAVNLRKNSSGALIRGTGLSVAVLDTGADSSHSTSGRPHRMYFRNGNVNDKTGGGMGGSRLRAALGIYRSTDFEDYYGHGTMTQACAAGARWGSTYADEGFAPDAWIVSMKLTSGSGGATNTAILANGWNSVLQNRVTYNIKAANASFGGSPSFTAVDQQALDNTAHNGDVLITVSSGNLSTNLFGTAATYNGLSVGSANKGGSAGSRPLSSFSGRGTSPYGKVVPDIVAIGASVYMPRRDSENVSVRASGTSFSSPMTAGAALLVRHANPKLTALETKALLQNETEAGSMGFGWGAGYLRADLCVDAAIKNNVFTKKILRSSPKLTFSFSATASQRRSVTIAWNRVITATSPSDDLTLSIFGPNGLVGKSTLGAKNSYDKVVFTPSQTGVYRAEVTASFGSTLSSIDFAIAGVGTPIPPKKPVLTSISPTQVAVYAGKEVTLTGQELATVSTVYVGTQKVAPKAITSTTVKFIPPMGTALGQIPVKVENPAGQSNVLNLTYVHVDPPGLVGQGLLVSLSNYTDFLWMEPKAIGVLLVSATKTPTKIPGIVDLGIGNNFQNLFIFWVMTGDAIGASKVSWQMPAGFTGKAFYFQAAVLSSTNPKFPLKVSNILDRYVLY